MVNMRYITKEEVQSRLAAVEKEHPYPDTALEFAYKDGKKRFLNMVIDFMEEEGVTRVDSLLLYALSDYTQLEGMAMGQKDEIEVLQSLEN